MTIEQITQKYRKRIDYLDLEIILAHSLGKTREFVLTYPEYKLTKIQISNFKFQINRRIKREPLAYILGHKEFYGLDFMVNKYTLIPRPETEMMVEEVLSSISSFASSLSQGHKSSKIKIIDIGTGSGCIAISIAKKLMNDGLLMTNYDLYASDISKEALTIAKKNAKSNGVDKQIKFLYGSLLDPFINKTKKLKPEKIIITANLPYLSKGIYYSAPADVKKFEPKTALYSPEAGLQHYRILLEQIKNLLVSCHMPNISCYMEISPEQKTTLEKLIENIIPIAKIEFKKDLAKKWRLCKITM